MKQNPYRETVNHIHAPSELSEQVLRAAAKEVSTGKRRFARGIRYGVCAACAVLAALALVLYPQPEGTGSGVGLGLTAYAADTGTAYGAGANATLVFAAESDLPGEDGCYTGSLFQVTGENLETLTLSLSRGELYRWRDGETVRLGQLVTENYDPAVRYGFWVEDGTTPAGLDTLDGAVLTVTAAYADGAEERQTYDLSTGLLRREQTPDGARLLEPALTGDVGAFSYGIYAASAQESRFFQWPVAGADTVSMSNPFGAVGKATGAVHHGIDIPGRSGMSVTAAADGTVRETGFDPERGNYLVLDHGGGLTTVYAQCREVLVEEGQSVRAGEAVACLGSAGMSTGAHLCFQVWQDGTAQNPVAYFESSVRRQLKMA